MATKAQSSIRLPGAASSGPIVLSPIEREIVCAVLKDALDQLAVLGGIMPDYASSAAAVEHVRAELATLIVAILDTLYYMYV